MTVLQNAGYGPLVQRRQGIDTRKLIDETLEIVGLGALTDRYPAQLSGGQKQRVALARAIICQPKVILLDEPLAALDATLRRQMQVFLKQIQRRIATTFVFVTHDQDEAITMSDRIVVMNLGRIEQVGTPTRPLLPAADALRGRLLRRQQPDPRDGVGCDACRLAAGLAPCPHAVWHRARCEGSCCHPAGVASARKGPIRSPHDRR